jgi:hypothetical protein
MRKYVLILVILLSGLVAYWLAYRFSAPSLSHEEIRQLEQLKCDVSVANMLITGQHITSYSLTEHSEANLPAICDLLDRGNLERVDYILYLHRTGGDHPELLRLLTKSKPLTFHMSYCAATNYRQVLQALQPDRLRHLTLHGPSVNDELLQLILERFPLVETLQLGNADVTDDCVQTIIQFKKVTHLTVHSNRLTNSFLDRWKPMQTYTTLCLKIADDVSIAQLSQVARHVTQTMWLDGMRLKGGADAGPVSKVKLDQLYLWTGSITSKALAELLENYTVNHLSLSLPWADGEPVERPAGMVSFNTLAIGVEAPFLKSLEMVLPPVKQPRVIQITCHAENVALAKQSQPVLEAKGYQVVLDRHGN